MALNGSFLTLTDKATLKTFGSGNSFVVYPPKFTTAKGFIFDQRQSGIYRRRIQNVGTTAISGILITIPFKGAGYDYLNDPVLTPVTATATPHFILPAATADYDGKGGAIELDGLGCAVYIWSGNGTISFKALSIEIYAIDPAPGMEVSVN
jgi:hypothetical protein